MNSEITEKKEVQTEDIYRKLFEYTRENMEAAGKAFPCGIDSFMAVIGSEPRNINMEKLKDMHAGDYADALYLSLFQRLPEQTLFQNYADDEKEKILQTAVNEPAFSIRGMALVNNPYPQIKPGLKCRILSLAAVVKNSVFLRKLAKKMPAGLQNKIRGMFT